MRINGLDKISHYQGVEHKSKKKLALQKGDEYKVSDLGSEFQFAMKKLREKELDRSEKVNAIKKSIENRTYKVSADTLASKMLSDISAQAKI